MIKTLILTTVIMFFAILAVSLDKPNEKLNNNDVSISQLNNERQELLNEKRHDRSDQTVISIIEEKSKEQSQKESKQKEVALNEASIAQAERTVTTNAASRGTSRKNEEMYWLARIIEAEAEGESYIGKVAVGNVILNRVNSSQFPNTIYGVIFDKQQGYTQFSPVLDGRIYNTPSNESISAAQAALGGQRPVGDALYFLNPSKSQSFWITKNRQYMATIGDHQFYY
ncbi:cell wall hydrolase [Peptococcaceae bacterium 1198_IL3148]